MTFLQRFVFWIESTPVSIYLQNLKGMVPVVQTLHILSVALALSAAVMIDLRILGLIQQDRPMSAVANRFAPVAWAALGFLAVTGGMLIIAEPGRSLLAFQFQLKMALLAAAIFITLRLLHRIRTDAATSDPLPQPTGGYKALALVSLILWCAIIMAGRWIAYA